MGVIFFIGSCVVFFVIYVVVHNIVEAINGGAESIKNQVRKNQVKTEDLADRFKK